MTDGSLEAGLECPILRDLVHKGLLSLHGTRGAAFHTLARLPTRRRRGTGVMDSQAGAIIAHVRRYGRITNGEARRLLGVEDIMAMRHILRRMVRHGLLAQRGTSKQNTYYELGPAAGR